jgi:hypothetical protein
LLLGVAFHGGIVTYAFNMSKNFHKTTKPQQTQSPNNNPALLKYHENHKTNPQPSQTTKHPTKKMAVS